MQISFSINGETDADNMAKLMQHEDVRAVLAYLQELETLLSSYAKTVRVTITARIDVVEGDAR